MTQNDGPEQKPVKNAEGARPAREIVSKLSEHEKTVRDQEVLFNAQKYFGGLNDEEKALLGLNASTVKNADGPSLESTVPASKASDPAGLGTGIAETARSAYPLTGTVGPDWIWAGLTALVFAGVVGWVLAGR
jgi:hypothetical protein